MMEDSGAILYQISCLKDMLDQVNEEIESNIQVTREIESEIVKCSEFEAALAIKESHLTKSLYLSHFEIDGLLSVIAYSRNSLMLVEEELSCLTTKKDEMQKRIENKREGFTKLCLEFQREIGYGENNELITLLSEKELLQKEIHLLDKKYNALRNSMSAFVDEILEDLNDSNAALRFEIQNTNHENEKVVKDIEDLKRTFLSTAASAARIEGKKSDKSSGCCGIYTQCKARKLEK